MTEPSKVTAGWFSTEYSSRLSGRSRKDTVPELHLRRSLHAMGLRYRLQYKIAPRLAADIAFPKHKVVIWVDGCFWHGCPVHGRKNFSGPNATRWTEKMARNKARDERAVQLASEAGWRTLRVWECEVRERIADVLEQVQERIEHSGSNE